MSNRKRLLRAVRISAVIYTLGFFPTPNLTQIAKADPGDDCVLVAEKGWVRIMIYREVGDDQKGAPVLRHPIELPKGARQRIVHGQAGTNQRLHYDYSDTPGEELHGNIGFICRNNERIVVP